MTDGHDSGTVIDMARTDQTERTDMATTFPTTLTEVDVAKRVETITAEAALQSGSDDPALRGHAESATLCAEDAMAALGRWVRDETFPGGPKAAEVPTLPKSWIDSAVMWTETAADHLWGFRRPEGF